MNSLNQQFPCRVEKSLFNKVIHFGIFACICYIAQLSYGTKSLKEKEGMAIILK